MTDTDTKSVDTESVATKPEQQPHLSDLFSTGKEVTVAYPGKPETLLWVERPNPDQHEECMRISRSARARRYYELMDDGSDERLALEQEAKAMLKPALVEAILDKHMRAIERKSLNEVLFSGDFGSDWGSEGEKWSSVIDALQTRFDEINSHNKELEAADAEEGLIDIATDEEVERLSQVQAKFEKEVNERKEELVKDKKVEIAVEKVPQLRKEVMKQRIDLECDMTWFATFKYEQLYRAVRYPDDHTKLYFRNVSQIKALPQQVQEVLLQGLQDVDVDVDALKNLRTPLPS